MNIEVRTKYHPRLTAWHVRRVLKWLDPVDLAGVESIRLIDEEPDIHNANLVPAHLRGFTYNGRYVREKGGAVRIDLYTRDIYLLLPPLFRFTPAATLQVVRTLAHEVAHHLAEERTYVYSTVERYKPYGTYDERKEKACDSYAFDVLRKMSAGWVYKFGNFLRRRLSVFYCARGEVYWERKRYENAARYCFYASMIDNNNNRAGLLYHKAMKEFSPGSAKSNNGMHPTRKR